MYGLVFHVDVDGGRPLPPSPHDIKPYNNCNVNTSTLPRILSFLGIWQEFSVKLDDDSVVALGILSHIHVKAKIDGTHDGISALLMDYVLDGRAICINDLMKSVENRIRVAFIWVLCEKCRG